MQGAPTSTGRTHVQVQGELHVLDLNPLAKTSERYAVRLGPELCRGKAMDTQMVQREIARLIAGTCKNDIQSQWRSFGLGALAFGVLVLVAKLFR